MPECRCVSGIVVEEGTTNPQAGLTVKVGTTIRRGFLPVGVGHTDPRGRFSIDLGEDVADGETGTLYSIRVFAGATELTVEGDTRWTEGRDACDLVICVTYPEPCAAPVDAPPQQLTTTGVYGEVRHVDGTFLSNVIVEVKVVGLTGETLISTGNTGNSAPMTGWYGLAGPGAAADVLVKVFEPGTPPRYVGSSPVFYQAVMPLRVDVQICDQALRGPSEFTRIDNALSPLLSSTSPSTVPVDGAAWMAGRSNWSLDRVLDWLLAKRLNVALSAPPEPIYGLLREQFPKTKEGILARAPSHVRRALRIAKRDNIISNTVNIETFVTNLAAARAAALDDGDPDDIGTILRTSLVLGQPQALTNTQVIDFCTTYANHDGTDAEFWEAIAALSSFDLAAVNEAKRLIKLATIGLCHAPCVTAMLHELGTGTANLVGGWSVATWQKIAGDENPPSWSYYVAPLPFGLEGSTVAEQRAALAIILREHAQSAFPSVNVNGGLGTSGLYTNLSAVQSFFANPANAGVDLGTTRFYAANSALTFSNASVEVPALQETQRLYRIAPTLDPLPVMNNLAGAGYTSARDVARVGKSRFIASYTAIDSDGEETAREVFAKAESQTAMAATFFLQSHPSLGRLPLAFVPDDPTVAAALTDDEITGWSDLFGSVTGCQCKWCRSIHGPAAYLVDLLHWLSTKTAPSGVSTPATALDALTTLYFNTTTKTRRLDLTQLPLTCENTERVLPYIDLTLEILESIVAGTWNPTDIEVRSSDQETPELLASPQYTNPDAYDLTHLGGASVAPRTPFHQPLAEMRSFLAHLGLDRPELMRDFGATLGGSAPTDRHIAIEELGLSVEAAEVIEAPKTTTTDEGAYWSLDVTTAPTVRAFRRAAEVTYPDILDLLHTRAVNPNRTNMVEIVTSGTDPYDVSSYFIGRSGGAPAVVPTPVEFSSMRQVLRLWRATGWTLLELDKVLFGLGHWHPDSWSATTPLREVGDLLRLSRITEIPPVDLVAWFSNMDTWEDRETKDPPVLSLWDRTWLNTSIFPELEAAEAGFPFQLNGTRTQVADTSLALSDHTDKLHAVLGVDEDEIAALIAALDADSLLALNGSSVPAVTIANLSRLYRWTSIARYLEIDPTDAYTLSKITGISPFTDADNAIDYLEEVQELLAAGFSADELDYLLRHEASERVAPTTEFLGDTLGGIRDALLSSYATEGGGTTLATLVDDLGRRVSEGLGVDRTVLDELRTRAWPSAVPGATGSVRLPSDEDVAPASSTSATVTTGAQFTLLAGADWTDDATSTSETLPSGTSFTLAASAAAVTLTSSSRVVIPAGEEVNLTGSAYTFAANASATMRGDSTIDVGFPDSVSVVLSDGRTGTFDAAANAALIADTTATFPSGLTTSAPDALSGSDILKRLLRTAFWDVTLDTSSGEPWADIQTDTTYTNDLVMLEAVFKAVLLMNKLNADEDERAAWYSRISGWSLLDPASFTTSNLFSTYPTVYNDLKNTIDLFSLRARLPGDTPTFADIILSPTSANIADRTGWDDDSVDTVVTWMGTASVDGLVLALDQLDAIRRAGASAAVVASWAGKGDLTQIDSSRSREVVAAARSRYASSAAWANVARPVRDRVRKAQRDALVSYLIAEEASDDVEDADDLYERYLIDVSMNPEMLTSRVKQAACSVQLFIHRAMFGLEQWNVSGSTVDIGDYFNDEDRAEWEWMRTYRVWEAARKVFLYPENWIEPELRDDKTPFFRSLEKELAQGEIDDERSEQVMLDYLDRLHEVASLKILATLIQRESDDDGTIDRLHVFARSQSDPATYWYRWREDSATWTPWEKIEAGVQGDHLIPVVYNRRLMLFWAEFTEAQSDNENATVTSWWEIRLACTEYRDGRWSTKKLSPDVLSLQSSALTSHGMNAGALYRYGFTSSESDGILTITCYGANQISAIGDSTNFYVLGHFDLNPCTMEIEPSCASVTESARSVLDHDYWWSPGFWTFDYDEDLQRIDHLTINLGPYDENGEPNGDYSAVTVLSSLYDATVVVPSQWVNFVSQCPFFINVDKRVYFGVRADGDEVVEATLDFEQENTVVATMPTISALGSMREGTRSSNPASSSLTESEATRISHYLDPDDYASSSDAVNAILSADASLVAIDDTVSQITSSGKYQFFNFYHPHVCRFIREVRRSGVFGLLNPNPAGTAGDLFRQQLETDPTEFAFESEFLPTDRVVEPYPVEDIDFTEGGAYSQYNWEIFFHVPFYVATRLADAGRFDDAMDWLHCVFDPRTRAELPAPPDGETYVSDAKWWKFKPFLSSASKAIDDWVAFSGADGDANQQADFERQVAAWREDPFNPHLIARMRPGTYQKAFVMRYLDTLIGWGDQLFTKDTIEAINEATQLYVFAKKVLGDRPEELEPAVELTAQSYADLAGSLDSFGNALVAIENSSFSSSGLGSGGSGSSSTSGLGFTTYFCIPPNAQLLSYWDTVEDRLFKIRNGMNIAGVVRSLPLFEPPIDPAMLVRAAAAGVDIGAAVDGLSMPRPHHRFNVVFARAQSVASSLRSLGAALLSALEKRDSEALAVLRQTQEEALQSAVRDVREHQVSEAKDNLSAAKKQKRMVEARRDYYDGLIAKNLIDEEKTAGDLTKASVKLDAIGATLQGVAAILAWFPNVKFGPFDPGAETGGNTFASALGAAASTISMTSGALKTESGRLTTTASYKRRKQEWKFQKKQAQKELDMIEKQIAAAEIRVQIAKKELHNHDLQMSHSTAVREWMERKYTNEELYDWMVGQISTLHFQTYQLALSTAKKAQACFNYELGRSDSFVQPVYWDGLRKGLLAGERLSADLDRMDIAYLEKDAREFELIKHVSMAMLDPLALQLLRSTGECWFEIPEVWFDIDCPGHYFRRLKGVAVSIACVAGMTATVNAQLTLHGHATRTDTNETPEWEAGDYTSIVTSVAMNDAGVFSADPNDPRYLPFERRGAISRWHLKLTAAVWKQLDWDSISDLTMHLRYTARDGGASFRSEVEGQVITNLESMGIGRTSTAYDLAATTGAPVLFSAKRDAPDALYDTQTGSTNTFDLDLVDGMLPEIDSFSYERVLVVPIVSSGTAPTVTSIEGETSIDSLALGSTSCFVATVTISLPMTLTVVLSGVSNLTDILVVLLPAE